MRIVHISDLHASADEDFGQRAVAKALINDIREAHKEVPVDLVIFSLDPPILSGGERRMTS